MTKRTVKSDLQVLTAAIVDGITAYEREVLAPLGAKPPAEARGRSLMERKLEVAARIASHWADVELEE